MLERRMKKNLEKKFQSNLCKATVIYAMRYGNSAGDGGTLTIRIQVRTFASILRCNVLMAPAKSVAITRRIHLWSRCHNAMQCYRSSRARRHRMDHHASPPAPAPVHSIPPVPPPPIRSHTRVADADAIFVEGFSGILGV